jgi:alkylated DNA repair dioxygenase AlkB
MSIQIDTTPIISSFSEINSLLSEIKSLLQQKKQNDEQKLKLQEHDKIPGLYYIENAITQEEENELLNKINNNTWLNDLTRRVQHYGYKYDYTKRKINKNDFLGELPDWTKNLEKKIFDLIYNTEIELSYNKFDQLIVNEYKSGQGISAHTDCEPCFEDGIVSVTLGNYGIMTFRKKYGDFENVDIKLKRRSIVIMTGDSRYKWTHAIEKTKNKNFGNLDQRISLTFSKFIL